VIEQRRNQRFELRLPLELVRSGNGLHKSSGETRNVSSGGVLFTYGGRIAPGEPIEYFITLTANGRDGVRLRCMGKVLRTEGFEEDNAVAATLERYEFVRSTM
jgi:hypothetical protein